MTISIIDKKNNIPVKPMSYSGKQKYLMSILTPNDIIKNNGSDFNLQVNEEDNPIIFLYEFIK